MALKRRRFAARRRARCYSQEAFAEAAGVDRTTVARWESGETEPQPWHRRKIAGVLEVSLEELDGLLAEGRGAEGGSAGDRLDPDHPAAEISGRVPGVLVASILRTEPPADEPASLDVLVAHAQQAWRLRQQADYDALAQQLPPLIARAGASARALSDADQEQAIRVTVHAYNIASSLLKTVGDCHLGLVAADRAVQHAERLDDPLLTAAARYRVANVLLSAHRYGEATTVALQAADLVAPGAMVTTRSLATWGGLLLAAAVAAARAGRESEAWQLLGEAQAASRMLAADHADMYCIFGPTNLAIHGVQVAVELGNGQDAVRRAQCVNPQRLPPTLLERRGQLLIDLGHAHALLRDDDSAVAVLMQAHQVAPQEVRLSKLAHRVVTTILSRARAGVTSELRELAAAVSFEGST